MWIFTTRGFYSVVQHRRTPDILLVRARDRSSLENLAEDFYKFREKRENGPGIKEHVRIAAEQTMVIEETPEADYRYRMPVRREVMQLFMNDSIGGINYDNFKSAAEGDSLWHNALFEVWSTMKDYQTDRGHDKTAAKFNM